MLGVPHCEVIIIGAPVNGDLVQEIKEPGSGNKKGPGPRMWALVPALCYKIGLCSASNMSQRDHLLLVMVITSITQFP